MNLLSLGYIVLGYGIGTWIFVIGRMLSMIGVPVI